MLHFLLIVSSVSCLCNGNISVKLDKCHNSETEGCKCEKSPASGKKQESGKHAKIQVSVSDVIIHNMV